MILHDHLHDRRGPDAGLDSVRDTAGEARLDFME